MKQFLHYLLLLSWKHFSWTRPKNLKISGKLIVNKKSQLQLCQKSGLTIDGNFDCCDTSIQLTESSMTSGSMVCNNAVLELRKSIVKLVDKVHIKDASLQLNESTLIAGNHFRVHGCAWKVISSKIEIGNYFLWESKKDAVTYSANTASFIVGNNTRLQAEIVQSNSSLQIGSNSFINSGTRISNLESIKIGDYVMISYDCMLFDNNSHHTDYTKRRAEIDAGFPNGTKQMADNLPDTKPIVIEDDVWIGAGCIVLKGISIGKQSIVATATTVTQSVEAGFMVYGNPNVQKRI